MSERIRTRRLWYPTALSLLTLGTIAAYLVNLSANGWANSFYAAAVQAGSQNWEAFLFGSLDSANAITVDKPPAALWLMALSARAFGFSSFSMLLPQVLLAGVSVLMLAHSTRLGLRGHVSLLVERLAALGAGLLFALSPIVALMFRFNNPDALLVTLCVGAVVATQHALRAVGTVQAVRHTTRTVVLWLVLAGVCLGMGFLTKQFQVLLIVPGMAAAWMLFARTSWLRRTLLLIVPIIAMVITAGWWIALVELTPAANRPYVGGSQSNSFLELTFGYNGFGRLTGNESGSVGGGGGGMGGGGWGETGIARLLTGSFGSQIAWFLPTALFLLVILVILLIRAEVARRRRVRAVPETAGSDQIGSDQIGSDRIGSDRGDTDPVTSGPVSVTSGNLGAAVMLWGAWLVVVWLVLSSMNGIVHEYYTVALVPAIAVVVALGVALLVNRSTFASRLLLALVWSLTGAWQFILAASMSGVPGSLRWAVPIVSILGGLCLIVLGLRRRMRAWPDTEDEPGSVAASVRSRRSRRWTTVLLGAAIVSSLVIPTQLEARTIGASAQGSIVTIAGTSSGMGGHGGGGGPGGPGGAGGIEGGTGGGPGAEGSPGGGGVPGAGSVPGSEEAPGAGGGMGGLLTGSTPSAELTKLLGEDADQYTWVAATTSANQAAGYQLALDEPVMAIGGFNGTDPSPTLAEFKQLVAEGQIHWYIGTASNSPGGGGDSGSTSAEISDWVEANFTSTTVDSRTLYDLSAG